MHSPGKFLSFFPQNQPYFGKNEWCSSQQSLHYWQISVEIRSNPSIFSKICPDFLIFFFNLCRLIAKCRSFVLNERLISHGRDHSKEISFIGHLDTIGLAGFCPSCYFGETCLKFQGYFDVKLKPCLFHRINISRDVPIIKTLNATGERKYQCLSGADIRDFSCLAY